MARVNKFGMMLLCLLPLLVPARAQFGNWFEKQLLFNQAQSQAIFNAANSAIARGFSSGNGISSSSGVIRNADGTGYSWVGGTGADGVYHYITSKKK